MATLSEECCTIPQVTSDYVPKGTIEEQVDGLKIYTTGSPKATLALIAVYDVFGFHNNTKQFADLLSVTTNARVVIPDFFRGSQRPENREEMQVWIQQVGSWDKVKRDLDVTLEFLTRDGASKFGILGFCWGGKIAVEACKNNDTFLGAAAIHPSQKLVTEDAKDIKVPVALLPAKTDNDMIPFMSILETTHPEVFKKSVHRRFDDMHHGFAAARGDWSDPLNVQRANEALSIVTTFFKMTASVSDSLNQQILHEIMSGEVHMTFYGIRRKNGNTSEGNIVRVNLYPMQLSNTNFSILFFWTMSFTKLSEEQILKNLLAYGFDYAQTLCAKYTKAGSLYQFTQLLYNFYQSYNRGMDLIQWAVMQQVQCTMHAEELFREGSTATYLSTHLFHHEQMGTKYLHLVVGPLVQQLVANPLISKVEKADANADQNLELLFSFLEEFLERLRSTVLSCPLYIRELSLFFKKEAESKFPEARVVASSVLFLRFILPAIITPQNYGIWHDILKTPVGQKGLILAARILQSIANMCEVEQIKWSNHSKFNSFIVRMFPKMDSYINALMSEEKIRKARLIIEATIPSKPNIGEREAAARDLMRFLSETDEERTASLPRTVLSNKQKTPQEMQDRLMSLNIDENWKLQKTKRGSSLYSLRTEETPNMEFYKYAHPHVVDTHLLKKDITFKCFGIQGGNISNSIITTYSVPYKEYPPRKGYTRIDAHVTGYIIERLDVQKCKLTCLNYLDLKGSVPLWLKNLVGLNLLSTPIHIAKWCKERQSV